MPNLKKFPPAVPETSKRKGRQQAPFQRNFTAGDKMKINVYNGKYVLHTRGSGNLIWSTLTWSMRGTHMRLGNTMSEAMMSMMASSDNELEKDR